MLLEAARNGDEQAFRLLVEGECEALRSRCYRMLKSADDADDAVQETLLRAWRGLAGFRGQSSTRTWLPPNRYQRLYRRDPAAPHASANLRLRPGR